MFGWFAQTAAVIGLNLRSLPQRAVSSLVALIGIAGVVMVMVGVLSIAKGFKEAMVARSLPETVMVLRSGSTSELDSGLSRDHVLAIEEAPGIAQGEGGALISGEVFVVVDLLRRQSESTANVPLRGVKPNALGIRPNVQIVAGRMFEPGVNELVVGAGAQRQFAGLELGETLQLGQNEWQIVGVMSSGGGIADAELWTDIRVLQSLYRRGSGVQTVRARLQTADGFPTFKDALTADPRVNVRVVREAEFYAEQSRFFTVFVSSIGYFVGALMGLGALFGAVNTMYTAVASRTREIATLRALGFGPGSVLVSVLLEALLIGLIGGIAGGGLAFALFNGFSVSTLNWQSFSQMTFAFAVTPDLLVTGIVYSLLLGLFGGLMPGIRAARLPVTTALREL
jgi:putative ABC transport system permease protein